MQPSRLNIMGYSSGYWISKVPNPPTWKKLAGDHPKVDVAIVGGGITGLSAAIKLKEQGKKVAVIEALNIGTGVTSNSTAKLSSLHNINYTQLVKKHGEQGGRYYAQLNEHGINLVEEYCNKYGIQCDFERRDNVTYTKKDEFIDTIKKEVEAANQSGLKAEFIQEMECLPYPIKAGIKLRNQAQFNPYKFVLGLAEKVEGDGSFIFENSRVKSISESSPHKIKTKEGNIKADYVILATHLPILDRSGHFAFCKPTKSYCLAYELKHPMPQDMSISVEMDPTISIRDDEGGKVLIIGGSGHTFGKPTLGSASLHYQELERFAKTHFPVEKLLAKWSAHDYMPVDQLYYIGRLHRATNTMFTCTGMKKWGLAAGVAASTIFSDLIQKIENPWLSLFDATRFELKPSSLFQLGKIQYEVGKFFVGDRVKDFRVPSSSQLKKGEGGIVKHNGKVCAMYKYPG